MLDYFLRYKKFFGGLFLLSIIIITLFYYALKPKKTLPVYGPSDVNPELVDSTIQHVGKTHRIADFIFTNQYAEKVTQNDYDNCIYVADFFFTTCPTICPVMSKNKEVLQSKIKDYPNVKILSHTVMPEIDSVPILKAYADKHHAIKGKWNLVTGDKKEIYYMARQSYLAVKTSSSSELYDMVHTENFVLVDSQKRVRGFYDGTDLKEIERLFQDIKWLVEKDKNK
jgi:protein SCO1/2